MTEERNTPESELSLRCEIALSNPAATVEVVSPREIIIRGEGTLRIGTDKLWAALGGAGEG